MEDYKKKNTPTEGKVDNDILFSRAIKAGKRIYYLDVKKNRKDEMYIAITESKKIVLGEGEDSQVNFEKHKIFLYKEDFGKFIGGLTEAISFIANEQGVDFAGDEEAALPQEQKEEENTPSFEIDIDF